MSDQVPINENELLRRLADGEDNAIQTIYQQYWEKLFTSAFRLLKDQAACEDIVQDIFLRLWLKRQTLVITTSLEAYLFTAVRYRVFQTISRGKVHTGIFENLEQRLWIPAGSDTTIFQKELQARVLQIVENLPEKCQLIYRLSREEHRSHREIAEHLSISTKTVENQLTIALRRIREGLPELLSLMAVMLKQGV